MKIVTICGAGIGSSGVLKINAERALKSLDLEATVVAADVSTVRTVAADAQIILTSQEFVEAIGKT
ncbi:MAG: PTS sugar transporter subunit IIB, partial [Salinibacterium amurskyense]